MLDSQLFENVLRAKLPKEMADELAKLKANLSK